MELISDAVLAEALSRVPDDHYVVWTGHTYRVLDKSLRSRALARVTEIGKPVPVREVIRRAARIDGALGYDPDTVRSGIRLHQGSKPSVYLFVRREPNGEFVAVTRIPFCGPALRHIREGEVIVTRDGRVLVECLR
jgi:hypothetical protein